jgi:hypothetical protein
MAQSDADLVRLFSAARQGSGQALGEVLQTYKKLQQETEGLP